MVRAMRRTSLWTLALAAMVILPAGAVAALEVPYLSGRVNDLADLISGDAEARIVDSLEDFENRTGHQVAVLTIPSLEGEVLEEFSLRVSETWGLGRSEQDDGVLLLVARDDRKMRIEVGYGLEADLTDAESGRILRNILTPRFKAGDFDGGIEQGVAAIVGTLEGKEVIPRETPGLANDMPIAGRLLMGGMFVLVVGMFSLIAIFTSGCQSWFLYAFLMPFWGSFPLVIFGPRGGLIALLAWSSAPRSSSSCSGTPHSGSDGSSRIRAGRPGPRGAVAGGAAVAAAFRAAAEVSVAAGPRAAGSACISPEGAARWSRRRSCRACAVSPRAIRRWKGSLRDLGDIIPWCPLPTATDRSSPASSARRARP